jgi:hypothetical protein
MQQEIGNRGSLEAAARLGHLTRRAGVGVFSAAAATHRHMVAEWIARLEQKGAF